MKTFLLIGFLFVWQFGFADDPRSETDKDKLPARGRSGVIGEVTLVACPVVPPGGCPPQPYRATISIFDVKGRLVQEVVSGEDGSFLIYLKPGQYTLVPQDPEPPHIWPFAYPVDVVVESHDFALVSIVYSAGI